MIPSSLPHRRGFALIITLSVLAVVIALTVVLLSYFNEVKKDADNTTALIQANVYYADILTQFDKRKDKSSILKHLYQIPLFLRSPDGRFSLAIKCKTLAWGVNINWLGMQREKDKSQLYDEAVALFEILAQEYDIEDADRLFEMIYEEIGTGQKFVQQSQSRLIQKNGIISYQQFSEIVKRYQMEVDDLKVTTIPWKKYFSFSNYSEKIDAEYSSAELISLLFDIDLRSVREWFALKGTPQAISLESFLSDNNEVEYNAKKNILASGFLGESRCTVRYGSGYKFKFDYIKGEAKYFEFYGKQ